MKTKEFIAHETDGFRLRVTKHNCLRPEGLMQVCFIRELKGMDGSVESSSTYEFFMTQEQLNTLAKGLIE
jgi:hypothetical protein